VRSSIYLCLCIAVLLTLSSCRLSQQPPSVTRPTPATTTQPAVEASSERDKILQEILDYQKRTGEDIESLAVAMRQGELAAPALEQDLDAARMLLRSVQDAANDQQLDTLLPLLHRLGPALRALEGDLPAAVVVRYMERALVVSQRYSGQEAINLMSSALLAARNTCQNSSFATLVPNVDGQLKSAKDNVDSAHLDRALPVIRQIIENAAAHASLTLMASCRASARGAEEAAHRQAWRVVQAELEQLDSELRKLEAEVRPAPAVTTEAPAAAPAAGETAVPGQEPTAGGQPPAPVPQPPAETTQPMQPATQ